jgi:hypothetical protein
VCFFDWVASLSSPVLFHYTKKPKVLANFEEFGDGDCRGYNKLAKLGEG